MAGLGRRTHYRKHLTDSVMFDLPEPAEHERIAKIVATRGGNQFDIMLPNESNLHGAKRVSKLAILPTKFRKLVWLKRNDFVIVATGSDDDDEDETATADGDSKEDTTKASSGGIRFIITHILYKEQVKHLRSKGLWPTGDDEFEEDVSNENGENKPSPMDHLETSVADDGIVYGRDGYDMDSDDEDVDDDLFVNTNRIANLAVEDSSDSEDDD